MTKFFFLRADETQGVMYASVTPPSDCLQSGSLPVCCCINMASGLFSFPRPGQLTQARDDNAVGKQADNRAAPVPTLTCQDPRFVFLLSAGAE